MNKDWEKIDLGDGKEHHMPKPVVGQGHPMDPDRGKILSEDDEKRVDDKGRPVAGGDLWSKAATGLYIGLAVTKENPKLSGENSMFAKQIEVPSNFSGVDGLRMVVTTTLGRPTLGVEYWGAALELPADLGRDTIKQGYVAEWLVNTSLEALSGAGGSVNAGAGDDVHGMAMWMTMTANEAINAAGL